MGSNQQHYDELKYLWEKLCNNDKEALGKLFTKTFDSLYNYGYRIVSRPEYVRDAIQEVFFQLWKYRKNLKQPTSVRAYLFVSLRRELLNKKEARKRREEIDHKYVSEEFDPLLKYQEWEEILELDEEENRELKSAIEKLSPRQREVIYLKYYEGLSTVELTGILNIRAQSIYNLAYDAINKLESYLDR